MISICTHIVCWAVHSKAPPRCLICDPPKEGEHHIKGWRRGDGIVTTVEITREIGESNAAGAASLLKGGWRPARPLANAVPLVAHEPPKVIDYSESPEPPAEVQGIGFWRPKEVVDAARAEYDEWLARQEKPHVVKAPKKQQVDRYVSPEKLEYDITFV